MLMEGADFIIEFRSIEALRVNNICQRSYFGRKLLWKDLKSLESLRYSILFGSKIPVLNCKYFSLGCRFYNFLKASPNSSPQKKIILSYFVFLSLSVTCCMLYMQLCFGGYVMKFAKRSINTEKKIFEKCSVK